MRCAAIVLACLLGASSAGAGPNPPVIDDPHARLRPTSELGRKVIDAGLARSATFRKLVAELETSDVIVYVLVRPNLPSDIGGMLEMMGHGPHDRYLRVSISSGHLLPVLVALLGHELQHVSEVVRAPEVDTAEELAALYRDIGVATGPGRYDSMAARETGFVVRTEFYGRGRDTRLARNSPASEDAALEGASIGMP